MPGEREVLACDIQRFSVHDGPGIRTTVFFKGCPLACQWCHNPETRAFRNELVFSENKCIYCGDCVSVCPTSAIKMAKNDIDFDHSRCDDCLQCVEVCPSDALSPAAKSYTSDHLLAEVLRDLDFYGPEGGLSLSGGEPLIHVEFLKEFLPKAKGTGLHIVAETSGYWIYEKLEPVLEMIDLFLFDLKVIDDALHREFTGRPNRLILENLERLVRDGHEVKVRTPFIPGRNNSNDNLVRTVSVLEDLNRKTITLLPYHSLGEDKLAKIGESARPQDLRAPSTDEMASAEVFFKSQGIQVERA